jgi:TfoX/Sxy family transcriptional regulator of competence genes
MAALHPHLLELLEDASTGLKGVTRRAMFGCEAMFVNGNIYGLVWKTGRIGLKLPDEAAYRSLLSTAGAERWSPSGKGAMGHWILVPEEWHDDPETLGAWTRRAHGLVAASPPRRAAAAAKRKADKATPRKKAAASKTKGRGSRPRR